MPLQFLLQWLTGLFSLALLLTGAGLVLDGWTDDVRHEFWIRTGYVLLAAGLLGRIPVRLLFGEGPRTDKKPAGDLHRIEGCAGELQVEAWGPKEAPALVLTHGWQMDRSIWSPTITALKDRYRIVAWDLPGLGESDKRADKTYHPDAFAADLDRVLAFAGAPAVLVGHSIGGMTSLSWARANRDRVGRDVAGFVIVDSTPVQPLETVFAGGFLKAIRAPVLEPLLRLTAALPWLARLMNLASYLNGTQYLVHRVTGFGRFATRENLDHVSRLSTKNDPGVGARGVLGVLRWDAAEAPERLTAPTRAVVGEHDLITRPDGSRFLAETAPDAEILVMDGCGHMGLLERPDDYARAVGEFADRVFEARRALDRPASYDIRAPRPGGEAPAAGEPATAQPRPNTPPS